MKIITAFILMISTIHVSAQSSAANGEVPLYSIHVITASENRLKGLLLEVRDTSVLIYPGKFKEWKKGEKYPPVEFGYPNIRELKLKRKFHSWRKFFINSNRPLFNDFKKTAK